MIAQTDVMRDDQTLITADAGYHSEDNLKQLHDAKIPALIDDGLMRRRDERFRDQSKYKSLPNPLADKSKSAAQLKEMSAKKRFTPIDFTHDLIGFCRDSATTPRIDGRLVPIKMPVSNWFAADEVWSMRSPSWSLRMICMVSMPAMMIRAQRKVLNPSMGRVTRLMTRWSVAAPNTVAGRNPMIFSYIWR